ncbi:MAG TPA: hypothetical protein VF313_12950 [Anaerolineaceae bacterium]
MALVTETFGLVFDGVNIWASNFITEGTITKIRPSDGAILGSYAVGASPAGMAFDGAFIWTGNTASSKANNR